MCWWPRKVKVMSAGRSPQLVAKADRLIWSPSHADSGAWQRTLVTHGLDLQVTVARAVSEKMTMGSMRHGLEKSACATALFSTAPMQSEGEVASKLTERVAPAGMLMAPKSISWPTWPEKAKSPETLLAYVQPAGRKSLRLTLRGTWLVLVAWSVKRELPPGQIEVGVACLVSEMLTKGGGQVAGPAAPSERPSPSAPTNVERVNTGVSGTPIAALSRSVVLYFAVPDAPGMGMPPPSVTFTFGALVPDPPTTLTMMSGMRSQLVSIRKR